MACILLCRVHDSQTNRKMDVTRECISCILELREILLSLKTGFNLVNAAVVCAILESISGLEPSSVITEPRDRHSRAPKRTQTMEMRCYRKILRTSYEDQVTNEEVRAKIQKAIGPHEDLLTIVNRRKLKWHGHVSCSSGLAKTILQGTVKEGRR